MLLNWRANKRYFDKESRRPQPVMISWIALQASLGDAMDIQGIGTCENSERVAVGFAGPDPQRVVNRRHEYLAVADLAGAGAGSNHLDRLVGEARGDGDVDPQHREKGRHI